MVMRLDIGRTSSYKLLLKLDADDAILYRPITSDSDGLLLRNQLNRLTE